MRFLSGFAAAVVLTILVAFAVSFSGVLNVAANYVEGRNLEIIPRSADGARERMAAVIDELVALKPDVIVSHAAAAFAARQVTSVPVVFGFSGDPIIADFTSSLARPTRNLTGITQIAPGIKSVVLMGDPVHPGADLEIQASEVAEERLGITGSLGSNAQQCCWSRSPFRPRAFPARRYRGAR